MREHSATFTVTERSVDLLSAAAQAILERMFSRPLTELEQIGIHDVAMEATSDATGDVVTHRDVFDEVMGRYSEWSQDFKVVWYE